MTKKNLLLSFAFLAINLAGATAQTSTTDNGVVRSSATWAAGTVKSSLSAGQLTFLTYNLGADPNMTVDEQIAYYSSHDKDAVVYGGLYQWGRLTDCHEQRGSGYAPSLFADFGQSDSDIPGHGYFIAFYSDWRKPKNDNLWNSTKTANDPCPEGFRVPTREEWESILPGSSANNVWTWTDNGYKISPDGGVTYTLFLPAAGHRFDVGPVGTGQLGYYWSSSILGDYARYLTFRNNSIGAYGSINRSHGCSVRCVSENTTTAVNTVSANAPVISSQYYDLLGKPVAQPQAGQIYIVKEQRQSGQRTTRKEIKY